MESLAQHVGTQANFLIVIGNVKGLLCGPESVVWCSAHSSSSPDTLLSTSARRPTDDGAVTWQEPFGTKCTLVKQPGASVYERKLLTFRVNIDTDTNKWWEGRIDVAEAVKRGSSVSNASFMEKKAKFSNKALHLPSWTPSVARRGARTTTR
ncbi:unnamed protein product (mitochondrion) [Plasmodiophora brassicae]|uniref:C2 NT-type domain-containing protein n=1 Tax=Plasmodiophora brassicae TaxID=37360 RepID=A0A3P3YDY5_PLABS|nr:unnamed protein product [Plasmodiophora brassicae]